MMKDLLGRLLGSSRTAVCRTQMKRGVGNISLYNTTLGLSTNHDRSKLPDAPCKRPL